MEDAAILDEPTPAFILMSRILLGMIALLLIIIPWSERYSALDSFPHGHDTELSLLTFFAIFGLILLFVRAAKKQLRKLLAVRYLLLSIIPLAVSLTPNCPRPPLPGSSLEMYNLPLQI
ncbi:MAG TPA: hypothetical protein VJV22_07950 [Acidobacteriaceae bacterium]|nr:hypothetical protein [Acidobacteriaceae bacterium]